MSVVTNRKTRPLITAVLAGGLLAGVVAGTSVTDVFTADPGQGGTSGQVALAGTKVQQGGDTCQPVDRVTPILIREGWDSRPEKITWRNGASTEQKHQFTFTNTYSARGMLTGDLPSLPSMQGKARAKINKKNKQQGTAMLGFELELSADISKGETIEYTVPARSMFIAKRGIWKQTWAIKRYQRWSNCQERWSHAGNMTGVGSMIYTSSKKLYR
ncbi:hypothetical protein [Streptomyces sp. N2A]|uniref:hypothetical protein n=1 Tax=Streptomyces sp. N2A TaxID=3073936 RepID=UPI002870604A|nr:hypothetical protein [Streptomyces sp. N2A]